jgi:hypothetical protein
MKGLGRTPSLGDRRGFMPPQLKTKNKAPKSDIFHFYTCEINIGDIWLQFEKLKKLRQMALSYRNIKNKC